MADDRPRFGRRGATPEIRARVVVLSVMLVVAAGLLHVRSLWLRRAAIDHEVIVEVRGDVPSPGYYPLEPPVSTHDALRAAGADPAGHPEAVISEGTRLRLTARGLILEPMDELLVIGLPVDVNTASTAALEAIPGVGAGRAAAIIAERAGGGPFTDVDALTRVKGIGPATVEALRPFVTAGP